VIYAELNNAHRKPFDTDNIDLLGGPELVASGQTGWTCPSTSTTIQHAVVKYLLTDRKRLTSRLRFPPDPAPQRHRAHPSARPTNERRSSVGSSANSAACP
jgi:hypothetical protein